jgi:hypothetical protein
MFLGTCQRWKQLVGYHYTGHSIKGSVLKDLVLQLRKSKQLCAAGVECVFSSSSEQRRECIMVTLKDCKASLLFQVNQDLFDVVRHWELIVRKF